jgi:hypothetical protein
LNPATPELVPARVTPAPKQVPLTGAYFWVPRPPLAATVIEWELVTCHDLGVWNGISHREFWPHIIEHLAAAWNLEAEPLRHRLADHYNGLPRGRINHPRPGYILLHGHDAPVEDWFARIIDCFHLGDVAVDVEGTEHESMASADLAAVEEALGVSLAIGRPVP